LTRKPERPTLKFQKGCRFALQFQACASEKITWFKDIDFRVNPGSILPIPKTSYALQNTQLFGSGNRLAAVADIELLEDIFQMCLYGFGRDEQFFRDFLVLQPLLQQLQNIELAVGQGLGQGKGQTGGLGEWADWETLFHHH